MSAIPSIIKSRQRRQERNQNRFSQRLSRIVIVLLIIFGLLITSVIVAASILYVGISKDLPSLETLPLIFESDGSQLPEPTKLFDRTGENLIAVLENSGARGRNYLSIDDQSSLVIDQSLISAIIAAAEPDYWINTSSFLIDSLDESQPIVAQRIVRGNLLIDQPPSLRRTLLERILVAQMISRFGREKVLEWYLNSADFGNSAYGADAAARVYFGKPATKLSNAEAALLVAAAETPSLNPIDAPLAAHERKEDILNLMFEQGLITSTQLKTDLREKIKIQTAKGFTFDVSPNFTNLVINQSTKFIRSDQLFRGGFEIITTLDYDLQKQLDCTIAIHSNRISNGNIETDLEDCGMARLLPTTSMGNGDTDIELLSSIIVTDPKSGQVLAVAGEDIEGHPPGSIITPFIYLTSFTRGANPASMIWDIPANLVGGLSDVHNPDGDFHGPVSFRRAMANDYLIPAIQTLSQMNPDQVWQNTRQLGIYNLEVPEGNGGLILPLQGGKLDLLELSQAYGIFASGGVLAGISENPDEHQESNLPVSPLYILKIMDIVGNEILDCTEELLDCPSTKRPVITPQLAYLITDVLSDETARWPSLGHPNPLEIGRPAAAKLGFTKSQEDVWTVGYTPSLVVSVWMGIKESSQESEISADWSAGLWHAVIQFATKDQPIEEFVPPPGINKRLVCEPSGLLPTEDCPHIVEEVFVSGNEPNQRDNLFQTLFINRETGNLATIFTSPALIEEETYLIIPPEAEDWALKAGIPQAPDAYDVLDFEQNSSPNARITSPDMFGTIKGSVPIIGRATGSGFKSYRLQFGSGLNPKTWLQIGEDYTERVQNSQLGVWDTKGLNGLYALQLIVSYEDGSVESTTIQVTVDNERPQVDFQFPQANEVLSLSEDEEITILIEANDDLELALVEILIDENLIASLRSSPFVVTWKLRRGEHLLQVKAIDRAGNVTNSDIVFNVDK